MLNSFQFTEKAAIFAAFLFLSASLPVRASVPAKNLLSKTQIKIQEQKFDEAKKKITSLLLLKQRPQALEQINELSKNLTYPDLLSKVQQLKLVVISSFLSAESQDYFELASGQYLNEPKTSLRNAQKCLAADPDQFFCLWAEAKGQNKNSSRYAEVTEQLKSLASDISELRPLILSLDKNQDQFINLKLETQPKAETYDPQLILAILEFDRSMKAKNYLLAKESLQKIEGLASDYTDIMIMRAQLHLRALTDETTNELEPILKIYKKKCEAVPAQVARKYFFDIDFCKRTLE